MSGTLVDSSVLLDLLTRDPEWCDWSTRQLERAVRESSVAVNPIVLAEVSVGFESLEEVEEALPAEIFRRLPLPWEGAFLAGKRFLEYRRRGGARRSPLPDFYIGAHAQVGGLDLLTRDVRRFRTYFPDVSLISPAG